MIRDIATVLILVSALGSWAFCVLYTVVAPWWETLGGRHVFSFSAVVGAVLTVWSVGLVTGAGQSTWFQILRLAAFCGVPVVIWWQVWLLVRVNSSTLRRTWTGGKR